MTPRHPATPHRRRTRWSFCWTCLLSASSSGCELEQLGQRQGRSILIQLLARVRTATTQYKIIEDLLDTTTLSIARYARREACAGAKEERCMPRSMWRGAIQFGLVTVPVKLYLATEAAAA